jgi:hypothetical protein
MSRSNEANSSYSPDSIQVPLYLKWETPDRDIEENNIVGAGDRIFQEDEDDGLQSFDLCSGEEDVTYTPVYGYTTTPSISGSRIYSYDMSSGFVVVRCFDIDSGTLLWTSPPLSPGIQFTTASGPIIDGNYLYFLLATNNPAEKGSIWAIDASTGAVKPGFPVFFATSYIDIFEKNVSIDGGRMYFYDPYNMVLYGYDLNGNPLPNFPVSVPASVSNNENFGKVIISGNKLFFYTFNSSLTMAVYGYDATTGLPLSGFPVGAGSGSYATGGVCSYNNIIYALDSYATLYALFKVSEGWSFVRFDDMMV